MPNTAPDRERHSPILWVLAILCITAIVLTLAFGAAYTGIESSRRSAALANLGQIESVLLIAELSATEEGLEAPKGAFPNTLKSYDTTSDNLTAYEQFILHSMLDSFGSGRTFDFAISRFQNNSGIHTYIYYFPVKGQTDTKTSRYYLMLDGKLVEESN